MKPLASRTLFKLLLEQAERFPDRVAVICGEQTASYCDLAARAARIAGALSVRGIGRGNRVGILINNRREWLECCFAAAALGAVAVPFSTWSKSAELDYLLADSGVDALFAVDNFAQQDFAATIADLVPEAAIAADGSWHSACYPRLRTIVMLGAARHAGWIGYEAFLADAEPIGAMPAREAARAEDDCL